MSGQNDARMNAGQDSLAQALRELEAPQAPDLWPQLAAQANTRGRSRRLRRIGVPLALAASLALAVIVLPTRTPQPPTPGHDHTQMGHANTPTDPLVALRQRSQRLQDWVRALNTRSVPMDGPALANATRLEDRIGMVDMQLSASQHEPGVQQSLWRQRVALLQQLVAVHLGDVRMASVTDTGSEAPHLIFN